MTVIIALGLRTQDGKILTILSSLHRTECLPLSLPLIDVICRGKERNRVQSYMRLGYMSVDVLATGNTANANCQSLTDKY